MAAFNLASKMAAELSFQSYYSSLVQTSRSVNKKFLISSNVYIDYEDLDF
jgi:hypothetical protein